jgi:hypothetical protein
MRATHLTFVTSSLESSKPWNGTGGARALLRLDDVLETRASEHPHPLACPRSARRRPRRRDRASSGRTATRALTTAPGRRPSNDRSQKLKEREDRIAEHARPGRAGAAQPAPGRPELLAPGPPAPRGTPDGPRL